MNPKQIILPSVFFILVIVCNSCSNDSKSTASVETNNASTDTAVILKYEQKLIEAYTKNDIETISAIYHDDLVFNTPDGRTITKTDDIESLRSGTLKIYEYYPSNYHIKVIDDIATVSVSIHIKGKMGDYDIANNFRFIRIWKRTDADWKLIAINGCQ